MKLLRLLTIGSFILTFAISAAPQAAMMQGDAQRYALDAESGTLKWSIDSGGSGMTPVIVDGVMYSLSYNGVLQAFR